MEAIYARQSLDKKDSVSIEAQIENCKKFLTSNEYEIYTDKGWSGKDTNRPRMNDLIKDIKANKITKIISYRLDRISRNIVDFGNLLNLFKEHKVEYVSSQEKFDTSTPMGNAMFNIVMVFAQLERETIANRIADNYRFRSSTGKYYMGGGVPYGYEIKKEIIDGKKASVIVPSENKEILKRIFEMFTSGYSLYNIVHTLNKDNIKTAQGKDWHPNGVRRILENITPCIADENLYDYLSAFGYNLSNSREDFDGNHGMCIFFKNKDKNKQTNIEDQLAVVGIHEPIIESHQYIKAQIILNENKKVKRAKPSQKSFLAGLLKCAECGKSFGLKTTSRKDKGYGYYYCRSRLSRGVCNNALYIKYDELENGILNQCVEYLKNHKSTIHEENYNKGIINNNDKIVILEQQIGNIINNIGKGNSVVDDLLTNKITNIQEEISKLKQETQTIINKNTNNNIEEIKFQLNNFEELDIEDKTTIIRRIIEYVKIHKDGFTEIKYLI